MRKLLLIVSFVMLMFSCSFQSSEKSLKQIVINELVFESDNYNKLLTIEIFNNSGDSLDINETSVVLNDIEFKLKSNSFLKNKSFGSYGLKTKLKNKEFKIQLKVQGETVNEINWIGIKKSGIIGRFPDGGDLFRLKYRSLGMTNAGSEVKISKPKFNLKTGVYKESQVLVLKQEYFSVPMFYTTDGSDVTKRSKRYKGPINVLKNTAIKACYISDTFKSKTKVVTLLIGEKTNLPIVSIVLDSLSFWDDNIGLIMKGPSAEKKFPYKGANYWKNSELPANLQVLNLNNKTVVDQKSGIKIHGNYSRVQSLKGLRVKSKKNNIKFSPFLDKGLNSFSEITLRGAGQDMGQGHLRDAFAHNYFGQRLNLDVQASAPVVVFVNAKYYGLMYFREVYNSNYFLQHYGCSEKVNMLKLWGLPMWGANSDGGYLKLKKSLDSGNSEEVVEHYDFKNWMDYYIVETYAGNEDWFPNNAKFWKSELTGKWRYVLNDLDAGFGRTSEEHYLFDSFKFLKDKSPNLEFKVFMKNKRLEQKFLLRYMDVLNTVLNPDTITRYALNHKEKIEDEMPRLFKHHAWKRSIKKWNEFEIPKLFSFYEKRASVIRNQLQKHFELQEPYIVKIKSTGIFKINEIETSNNIDVRYFPSQTITISSKDKDFSYFLYNGRIIDKSTIKISGTSKEIIDVKIVLK